MGRISTICFSSDSRQLRLSYCLILTLAHTVCLGLLAEFDEKTLWVLLVTRFLLGSAIGFLPQTTLGRLRPFVFVALLGALASSFPSKAPALLQIGLLFLAGLAIDLKIETITLRWSIESELSTDLALLYPCRFLGLLLGFSIKASGLLTQIDIQRSYQGLLVLMLTLVFLSRERENDSLLRPRVRTSKLPAKVQISDSLYFLKSSSSLQALSLLILTSALSGLVSLPITPMPVIGSLEEISATNLPVLGLAIILAIFLNLLVENVSLIRLTLVAYSLLVASLVLVHIGRLGRLSELGLETSVLFCCLLAYRWSAHNWHRSVDEFRAALLGITWTSAHWLGNYWHLPVGSTLQLITSTALSLGSLGLAALLCHTENQRPHSSAKPQEPSLAVVSERGYQEFETVTPPKKRAPRRNGFRGFVDWLTVGFPVNVILSASIAIAVATSWHVLEHREKWRLAIKNGWYRTQTEIFLSAIADRLEEEILVTNRVPDDWTLFIQTNFGKPESPVTDNDVWGSPLSFRDYPEFVEIRSAGQDKLLDTSDDLIEEAAKNLEEGKAL